MRNRVAGLLWAVVLLLTLGFGGCGPSASTPPQEGESPLVIAGPNHLAQLFVEAMGSGDALGVARLCDDEIADYYTCLARIGELNGRMAAALERIHPEQDESDRRRLQNLSEGWKRPMLAFRDLALDGRLRTELDGNRVVYQLAHLNARSRPTYPELVIERRDETWTVVSFGADTPKSAHLGAVRNRLSRLESSCDAAIRALEAARPRTVENSLKLLADVLSGQAGAPSEPGAEDSR